MQVDQNPFPMHMLKLKNPKVLVRPSQAESTKGKNVVIGEERPEKKLTQQKTPQAATKTSTLGGQDKKKKADSKSTILIGPSSGLTDSTGLTGPRTGLTGAPNESGNCSRAKNKRRPSFKEFLAKYEKKGIAQTEGEAEQSQAFEAVIKTSGAIGFSSKSR